MRIIPHIPRESSREYVLRTLKENIISMDLLPGEMVSENELSVQLGLSRTPIREAISELSKVKLIEVYPQRGSYITPIDYELVEDASFVRNSLECSVLEHVCQMIGPEGMLELRNNIQLQENYLAAGMSQRLLQLDNEFHRILFSIARKEQAYDMMRNFTVHYDRVRTMTLATIKESKIVEDHRSIAEAVINNDPETARAIMKKHLNRYKFDEQALRDNYPASYFRTIP